MPDASAIPVAYDPAWPGRFADEAERLAGALGTVLTGPVEHIGSTSVPGMTAKPIIDMMAPVASLADAADAEQILAGLAYAVRPHRVDAVLYVRVPSYGLHLTTVDSELWRERLAFRDALRRDDGLRAEYLAVKQRLLAAAGGDGYDSADKREFVREVLRGAGHELQDGLHDPRRGTG